MVGGTASGDSALLAAAQWIEGLIYSPAATIIAVLAIASAGLSMLTGRLAIRRGASVVLGCFVLFGAPTIARGLMSSAALVDGSEQAQPIIEPLPPPVIEAPQTKQPPADFDPYAGASVAG